MGNPRTKIDELYDRLCVEREEFEKYWKEDKGFNSNNPHYEPINELLSQINERLMSGEALKIRLHDTSDISKIIRVIADEPQPAITVDFSSDNDGSYYFNGEKVKVDYSQKWACKLLKTKVLTSCERPVDFYFEYLDHIGLYGTYGNPFYPCYPSIICSHYLQ